MSTKIGKEYDKPLFNQCPTSMIVSSWPALIYTPPSLDSLPPFFLNLENSLNNYRLPAY